MTNLLPQNISQAVVLEKVRRILVVVGIFISLIIVLGGVLLLPSYFSLVFEQNELAREQSILERTLELKRSQEIEQELSLLNEEVGRIVRNEEGFILVSNSLGNIVRLAAGLDYHSLSLKKEGKGQGDGDFVVTLSGTAPTRSSFVSFLERLELQDNFTVESPFENLLKEKDVFFRLKIIITSTQQ